MGARDGTFKYTTFTIYYVNSIGRREKSIFLNFYCCIFSYCVKYLKPSLSIFNLKNDKRKSLLSSSYYYIILILIYIKNLI